jgi:hypothetical protein
VARFVGLFHDCLTAYLQRYEESKLKDSKDKVDEDSSIKVRLSDINRLATQYVTLFNKLASRLSEGKDKLLENSTIKPQMTIHVIEQVLSHPDTPKPISKRLKSIVQMLTKHTKQ